MMNRNDFPEVSEQFDRSVRAALDSLPERTDTKRRFSVKRVLCAGLAAALCIGAPRSPRTLTTGSRCCFRTGTMRRLKATSRPRRMPE